MPSLMSQDKKPVQSRAATNDYLHYFDYFLNKTFGMKCQKMVTNAHRNFLKPKVMSSNYL